MFRTLFTPKESPSEEAPLLQGNHEEDRSQSRGRPRNPTVATSAAIKFSPSYRPGSGYFSGQPFSRYQMPVGRSSLSREHSNAVDSYDENEDAVEDEQDDEENRGPEEGEDDDEEDEESQHDGDDEEEENEDGPVRYAPLLPMFSRDLDSIPVYEMIHEVRQLLAQRTDTSLTWDQLRSPQVSQFLVRPMINKIRENYKQSPGLIYALMANCLQFSKESGGLKEGTNKTRAMLCELAAIKLLKDYTPRQMIDALSYDFYPLQGAPATANAVHQPRAHARVSALEITIRTHAKRFLASALVVQQLEAIWAGNIVFSSEADSFHRKPYHYGYTPGKNRGSRRAVTIYDPGEASIGKLSRLRVPLYRQTMSTLSLTILLGLYLAVLIQRSPTITTTEVILWFWSAGFMLDEIVGVTETGFELYLLSLWNAFDIGILALFMIFYILRLYGLVAPEEAQERVIAVSYDILATCAIFLFPRLFSILDHYRYFSQMLIGFKLMFADLFAIMFLILISCSGFFVAFTLSFARDVYSAKAVAYSLMQMTFGFTPAAWDSWGKYNVLGKIILIVFLTISHFLIVTILITVMTNSYLKVSENAYEEHQFVFAVNTISLVKSDAMFMYIAPFNIIELLLHPLRYVMPLRRYIYLNRTIIKTTHFPLLFVIYLYEKIVMPSKAMDNTATTSSSVVHHHDDKLKSRFVFRRDSMLSQQKDSALDEVFRRPRRDGRNTRAMEARQKADGAVTSWMRGLPQGNEVSASRERERERDYEEESSPLMKKAAGPYRNYGAFASRSRDDFTARTMSVTSVRSDPEEFLSGVRRLFKNRKEQQQLGRRILSRNIEDGDGDDELFTNDEEEPPEEDIPDARYEGSPRRTRRESQNSQGDQRITILLPQRTPEQYARRNTVQTVVYDPISEEESQEPVRKVTVPTISGPKPETDKKKKKGSSVKKVSRPPSSSSSSGTSPLSSGRTKKNGAKTPTGAKTPKGTTAATAAASSTLRMTPAIVPQSSSPAAPPLPSSTIRPTMPRIAFRSVPNFANLLKPPRRFGSDGFIEDDENDDGEDGDHMDHDVGSLYSFQTKMAMANSRGGGDDGILGRLLLTKIGAIEEGFKDVAKELKELKNKEKEKKELKELKNKEKEKGKK